MSLFFRHWFVRQIISPKITRNAFHSNRHVLLKEEFVLVVNKLQHLVAQKTSCAVSLQEPCCYGPGCCCCVSQCQFRYGIWGRLARRHSKKVLLVEPDLLTAIDVACRVPTSRAGRDSTVSTSRVLFLAKSFFKWLWQPRQCGLDERKIRESLLKKEKQAFSDLSLESICDTMVLFDW